MLQLLPALSLAGALISRRASRSQSPLIKPGAPISGSWLSFHWAHAFAHDRLRVSVESQAARIPIERQGSLSMDSMPRFRCSPFNH